LKRLTLFCLTAVLMTACNRSEPAMSHDLSNAEADVAAGGRGLATLNPAPVKAYQITLRLHGAPGAFQHVRGTAQYDVINEDQCGNIEPATGTASRITSQEPLELTRISDEEYQGTVYLDRMKDQDYYGRGICRWEFTGAGALLKATGAREETRFLTFVDAPDLVAGKTYTRYYPKHDYPRAGPVEGRPDLPWRDDYPSRGREDRNEFVPALQDKLFSITVSAVAIKA
jgi:hypothetical protein